MYPHHTQWLLHLLHANYGPKREVRLKTFNFLYLSHRHHHHLLLLSLHPSHIPPHPPVSSPSSINYTTHFLGLLYSSFTMNDASHSRSRTSNQLRMNSHHYYPKGGARSSSITRSPAAIPAEGVSSPPVPRIALNSHVQPAVSSSNPSSNNRQKNDSASELMMKSIPAPQFFAGLKTREYREHRSSNHSHTSIRSIAWNILGNRIACGLTDKLVRVWNPEKPEIRNSTELKGHSMGVDRVAWDPTHADKLVSCGGDGIVRFWDYRSK